MQEDFFGWQDEPKAKKLALTWVHEACQDWETGVGGVPSFVRVGAGLKPLVKLHGWEEVRRAWQHYLKVTEPHFASPQRFSQTYRAWILKPKITAPPPKQLREVLDGNRWRLVADG